VVVGADGKSEMLNCRVKEQRYIADRLFDHAQLILGAGKKAHKVEINITDQSDTLEAGQMAEEFLNRAHAQKVVTKVVTKSGEEQKGEDGPKEG
jgi:hypothetical protein